MIRKFLLILPLLLVTASFAAGDPGVTTADEDEEILADLEFFRSLPVIQNLDEEKNEAGPEPVPAVPFSKKIEVKHENP
jgi:hypothetical protein